MLRESAILVLIAVYGISTALCNTQVVKREIPWAAEFAWTVESVPLWPVLSSCSNSKASPPRISPKIMRSGRCLRVALSSPGWSRQVSDGCSICNRRAARPKLSSLARAIAYGIRRSSKPAASRGNPAARRCDLSAPHAQLTSDVRGPSPHQLAQAGRRPESPASCAFRVHGQCGLGSTERYLKLAPERFRNQLVKLSPQRGRKHWRDDAALMKLLDELWCRLYSRRCGPIGRNRCQGTALQLSVFIQAGNGHRARRIMCRTKSLAVGTFIPSGRNAFTPY
jgi:hypothetical protein